jgi:hypothetical protein
MHIALSMRSSNFKHTELEKWINTNTNKLNIFEKNLKNGHTQTMRHRKPLSKIDKHKKDTMIKLP